MPACDDLGAPAAADVVLLGSVGGVVGDDDVVLGGIADPGADVAGVGDVAVGDAAAVGLSGVAPDVPVAPGAPGEPALPIEGFVRTKDGVAAGAMPVELVAELTQPVTVTIGPPAGGAPDAG